MRNSKFRIGILIIAAVIFSETQVGSQEALKIFPGAKVVWEKQYEVPLDFRVAKRSGNLILKKGSEVLYFGSSSNFVEPSRGNRWASETSLLQRGLELSPYPCWWTSVDEGVSNSSKQKPKKPFYAAKICSRKLSKLR